VPTPPANADAPSFVVTMTLIVADVARSQAFYRDVFGATTLRESDASLGEPAYLQLGNIWLIINVGGGPTDDKPAVIATPPLHPNELSGFMNLRVSDIARFHELWRSRGATFITDPKVHRSEIRCYIRDPDGYLIEVGQTTSTPSPLDLSLVAQRATVVPSAAP
jgi:catechol 2,3-dioxygenase-like lactoylglutathione lyase family enzyme